MASRKPYFSDSDSTKAPIPSLDPFEPVTNTKEPSSSETSVTTRQRLKDYYSTTTHTGFLASNVPVWVVILSSLRLCSYLDPFDPLHILLEGLIVCISGMFFVWKNFEFCYSANPRRKALALSQRSGILGALPTAAELVLAAITVFAVVVEPLELLPPGVVLILGDVIISGFLAWMVYRSTTGPVRAGTAEFSEDTETSSASTGLQKEETGNREIYAMQLPLPGSTDPEKLTISRPAANTSHRPVTTANRSKVVDAARHDSVEGVVDEAVSIFYSSPEVQSILAMMLNPSNSECLFFGALAMDRGIVPILCDFGRNLAAAGEKGTLAGAAKMLQSEQGSIVMVGNLLRLVSHLRSEATYRRFLSKSKQALDGRNTSAGAPSEPDHRAAVSGSSFKNYAQLTFEWDLIHCVRRRYEDRLCSIMAGATLVGQSGTRLSPSRSLSIIRELCWVPPDLISIVEHKSFSISDDIKSLVELQIGETWNWWPLAPASRRLRAGYHRLAWKSPLGAVRYVDFPDHMSDALRRTIVWAPGVLNIELPLNPKSSLPNGGTTTAPSSGSGKSSLTPSLPNVSSPKPPVQPSPTGQSNLPPPLASQNAPMVAQGAATSISISRYLSLCVTASSHQFVSIRCDTLRTDLELYTRMKHEYNGARGWLRLYFSMWQYDHCEFVRFKKYGYHRGARLKVAFPEHDDLNYDFAPRVPSPAPPDGPVSSDEFRDHYYLPECPSFYSWRRYQLRFRGHFSRIAREALEAVPKRHTEVNMDDGLNELFYGLYAKERRSFARVASYACLCNFPGIVFFFLWLFRWGHGADLQNASVPLTLSLSLTLGFAAVVFGTRDGG